MVVRTTLFTTFVMFVCCTTVFVTFTFVTYVGLVWYAGTYTSPGASGNHATLPPASGPRGEFDSPTNTTSAGE